MASEKRRDLLKKLSLTGTFAFGFPNLIKSLGQDITQEEILALKKYTSANDKINFGVIGYGMRGYAVSEEFLKLPNIQLTGVCDIYDGRCIRAKELKGNDLYTTRFHEDLINRKDIDAVIIAGTHHWNAKISTDALKAGKAVFCEKPMIQKVEEGPLVIAAEKAAKKTFLVGSQRVSSIIYEKAKQLYKSGAIGELNYVEAWWDRNSSFGAWQYSVAPDASEKNIDWQRFLGNAPKVPFDPVRLFRWRNYKDYSTGVAGDLFVHLFSGLHYILDSLGPEKIYATGGLRHWKDGRDIPDVLIGMYDYPSTKSHPAFNLVLRTNFVDGSGGSSGFKFVGSEGTMTVGNDIVIKKTKRQGPAYNVSTFPEEVQKTFKENFKKQNPDKSPEMEEPSVFEYKAPKGYNDLSDHLVNFALGIRESKPMVEDATFGYRASAPASLTNQSYYDSKIQLWDPIAMKVKK